MAVSLPPESSTAQRNTALRELQSRFPLASGVVHHGIRELWVVMEMKDSKLSMEWQYKQGEGPSSSPSCSQAQFSNLCPLKVCSQMFLGWSENKWDSSRPPHNKLNPVWHTVHDDQIGTWSEKLTTKCTPERQLQYLNPKPLLGMNANNPFSFPTTTKGCCSWRML